MAIRLLLLLCLLFPTYAGAVEISATTTFESGTFEGWSTGSGVTLSTARAHGGTHSVRIVNSYGGDKLFRQIGASLDVPEVVVVFYWYTESWDDSEGVKFFRLRGTTAQDNPYIEAFVHESSSPWYYYGGVFRDSNNATSSVGALGGSWTNMGLGSWTQIMVQWIYNTPGTANGTIRIWFNGVLRYQSTSKMWLAVEDGAEYVDWICVTGNPGTGADMTNSIHYIDDITVYDAIPGTVPTPTPTPVPDTTAPILSGAYPTTAQTCTSDPRNITLGVISNEAATCRYGVNGTAWASMSSMSVTGGTTHTQVVSLACGASYQYDIICRDTAGNESIAANADFSISSAPATPTPTPSPTPTPEPPTGFRVHHYGVTEYK